jgi:hypothetical protein
MTGQYGRARLGIAWHVRRTTAGAPLALTPVQSDSM